MITFIDRPCGFGKTTDMLNSLDDTRSYLIVVPSLDEVERVVEARPDLKFRTPDSEDDDDAGDEGRIKTKSGHLVSLIKGQYNIVCTHQLYNLNKDFYGEGWLLNYDIIIDEVLDVVECLTDTPKERTWKDIYVKDGYVEIQEDGRILPTELWHRSYQELDDALSVKLYQRANSGRLYTFNKRFFLWTVAPALLTASPSITIMSFLVQGSLMALFLDKLGLSYNIKMVDGEEEALRNSFKQLCDIKTVDFGIKMTYSAQTIASKDDKAGVAKKLRSIKTHHPGLKGSTGTLITCAKSNWCGSNDKAVGPFARGSRLAESSTWVANITRGTNNHRHCDSAVYLYDKYMNPGIKQFLGVSPQQEEQYALSEVLQWVYRTRLRDGEPITLVLGSKRMERIITQWVNA